MHQWFVYRQTLFAENGERYYVLGGISNSAMCTCILFDYEVNEKVMSMGTSSARDVGQGEDYHYVYRIIYA